MFWLPQDQIEDWPDLELREIYWDDAHHLERPEALKKAIRQAAFYKVNGFALKLEGHFQFKSAPALVEPYALTTGEYQDLTNYGLRYHVQLTEQCIRRTATAKCDRLAMSAPAPLAPARPRPGPQ
jgi:hypothetical protein